MEEVVKGKVRMAKTLAEVHDTLKGHGYTCTKVKGELLVVPIPTNRYRSPSGRKSAELFMRFNDEGKRNACLTVEIPWAFDAKKAVRKEMFYECLLEAAASTPLVKSQVNPNDGEVRFRIDCSCGRRGLRQDDLFRAIQVLASFADDWYARIVNVMNHGEPLKVDGKKKSKKAAKSQEPGQPPPEAESIARRAGGVNRLKVLFEFQKRLAEESKRNEEKKDGDNN